MITESQIITEIVQGNRNRYAELVAKYQGMVFRTAMGFVHSKDDADDLTQETFIRAWEALHTFKFDSAFSTWLYRIAVNSCLNHTARLRRRNLLVTAGDALRQLFMFEDPQRDPHGLLEDEQRDRAVREAIGLLPEKQRTAFVLSKYDDLTQKEIAAIMHTTEGAVEQLLQRAKSALRKKLNPIVGK